jgi:hypothetical protein
VPIRCTSRRASGRRLTGFVGGFLGSGSDDACSITGWRCAMTSTVANRRPRPGGDSRHQTAQNPHTDAHPCAVSGSPGSSSHRERVARRVGVQRRVGRFGAGAWTFCACTPGSRGVAECPARRSGRYCGFPRPSRHASWRVRARRRCEEAGEAFDVRQTVKPEIGWREARTASRTAASASSLSGRFIALSQCPRTGDPATSPLTRGMETSSRRHPRLAAPGRRLRRRPGGSTRGRSDRCLTGCRPSLGSTPRPSPRRDPPVDAGQPGTPARNSSACRRHPRRALSSLANGDRLGEQHLWRAPARVPGELGSAGHALRVDAELV